MKQQELDRRGMLGSLMGGATLLGLGNAGCSSPQEQLRAPETPVDVAVRLDPAKANDILVSLDKRMGWIGKQVPPDDVLALDKLSKAKNFDEEYTKHSGLIQKSMKSLYLTGRFLDMPDEYKVHPGVQARIRAAQKDMDDAVMGVTEILEKATPEDFQRVQDQLRKDPLLAERIAKWVEQPAIDDGMPFERRFATRASILQLAERMRAQSPALVTDPIVSKVRRIEALPNSEAEQIRRITAKVGEEAFWKHQQHLAALHAGWLAQMQTGQGANSAAYAPPAAAVEEEKPGQWSITRGGIIMGFGGGSVLVGLLMAGIAGDAAALSALWWTGIVLGVTIGPILLIIGLIFILVGLAQRAAS